MIRIASSALLAFAFATSAQATTITVTPSLAPNAFGSPSYTAYVANATGALHDGDTSRGTVGSPAYYQAQSNVTASQGIVTGFPSWMGRADPGTVYGAAYANELGNRMLFGIKIDGEGTQFAIADLSFTAVSSDGGNALGFSFAAGDYNYSDQYKGVLKGADNMLFTADDTFVTSGLNTQLVDALVGRGSGSSLAAYCDPCTIAQQQAAIDDAASYFSSPTTFTGTYTLNAPIAARGNAVSGSGTFNIQPDATAIPEPASWMLLIAGFGLLRASTRQRKERGIQAA